MSCVRSYDKLLNFSCSLSCDDDDDELLLIVHSQVIFTVESGDIDEDIIHNIQASGWTVVRMWALLSESQFASGIWSFFSPCRENGQQTTSVADETCVQLVTKGMLV